MNLNLCATIAAFAVFACSAQGQDAPPSPPVFASASVLQNLTSSSDSPATANFPLNTSDAFAGISGHLLTTGWTLANYLQFAYKMTDYQVTEIASELPAWAMLNRYDIDAQAADPATTKDQMRQMMAALLADQFQLSVHHEARQRDVFSLQQVDPTQLGPALQIHPPSAPCTSTDPGASDTPPWPVTCGEIASQAADSGLVLVGARQVNMPWIADQLTGTGNLDRPVVDHTSLGDSYDFAMQILAGFHRAALGPAFDPVNDPFAQAVAAQLGMTLTPGNESLDFIIVDGVQPPVTASTNSLGPQTVPPVPVAPVN